ncbi:MAG TPA: wax ester/triacylglycerol synthase family O-acyltransferase [Candidatus Limnocylindrales bacterium]|nr:wax ester/triacylglycerol synthase family O-acyltransferase [Candidatus Limnocylindrales bacterium]
MTTFCERLSALDRFFLDCESDRTPMHIGAACLFDAAGGGVDIGALRDHIAARLDLVPRYRRKIAWVPLEGHPVWIDDAAFDLTRHVRAVSLPGPGTPQQLEEMLAWIFSQPLPRTQPLWEVWLIQGLAGGQVVLACKTHHCLVDGLGGAALLAAILSATPFDAPAAAEPWSPQPAPGGLELLADAAASRIGGAAAIAARLVRQTWASPQSLLAESGRLAATVGSVLGKATTSLTPTVFDEPAGSSRRLLSWTCSLQTLRGIGRRYGATVNDVVLALVADGFARCPDLHGEGESIRAYCPVGASASASVLALGNRVAGMLVDLPTSPVSVEERLAAVARATREQKSSGEVEGTLLVEELANALAPSLLANVEWLVGLRPVFNLIVTNVPGPQASLYLFNHRMVTATPLVPLFHGQGLGIAVLSYDGQVGWGFHVDSAFARAGARLRDGIAEACADLAARAGIAAEGSVDIAA